MSGYQREEKTFILTATKMEHYHRHHTHATFSRNICPICHAQYGQEYMQAVARFLTANGFDVVDVGDAHVTISAPSKPRKKFGMWITKETDALYQLLAGRTEPQPSSLPQDDSFLESGDVEIAQDHLSKSPIRNLADWLNGLKEQKQNDLQYRQCQHANTTDENRVIQTEIALIERIQAKIHEILESH